MSSNDDAIPTLLTSWRTIAVVGLSIKPHRASHQVAHYMQRHGYRIIPVNPSYAGNHILNEYCYASLSEAAAALAKESVKIEIVDCFRKSEAIPAIADEAIAIGVQCLWLQLGVINQDAAAKARAAGLVVVMDRCIKVEHMQAS